MSEAAAPPSRGRRFPAATLVGLVTFLVIAPPLFVLGPLLLLLLLSRPSSVREWLWIVLSAGASYLLASSPGLGLPSLIATSGGAILAGVFAVASHTLRDSSTLTRAALSVAVAAGGLIAWGSLAGLSITDLDAAMLNDLTVTMRALLQGAPPAQLEAATASLPRLARLFPGTLAVQALAGTALAWAWYHQIARRPVGHPPRPFRDLRFNDHLIWGAIFTLGLSLVPLPDPVSRIVANLLVVWSALYAARGLAVGATSLRRWPLFARLLIVASAVLVLPVAIGALVLVGLADTWVDFRRRLRPPPSGGTDER